MKLHVDPIEESTNRKIAFSAHPVKNRVFLYATIDQKQFDELAASGAIFEDNEDDTPLEVENFT